MADLNPLIRVRKHALEQKQKFLAELYRQAEELENQKKTLLDQLEEERTHVKELGVEMLSYFGPYSEAVKERVKDIDDAAGKLSVRINIARADMRETFAEFKKIEMTQERREKAERDERERKEARDLDETALEGFRRKTSDPA